MIRKNLNSEYFESSAWKTKNPGIAAFDADGTIIKIASGDHWFTLINQLPTDAQERISNRVKLLGRSKDEFEQKFLSAASLYEFALNGWTPADLLKFASKIQLREGVAELFLNLQTKGYQVVIISYGIKVLLEEVLRINGIKDVTIFADALFSDTEIAPTIPGFIPSWQSIAEMKNNPPEFNNYVNSMAVSPTNKGVILEELIEDSGKTNARNFSVGDSEGDIELFHSIQKYQGCAILHLHTDKPNKYINDASQLDVFEDCVNYFCENKEDGSFEPTAILIQQLSA